MYEARVLQELSEKTKEGKGDQKARSQVIDTYTVAWKPLTRDLDERSREAKEGLAGAIVAESEFVLKSAVPLPEAKKAEIRENLNIAIQMQNEIVEFAWNNSSSRDWAGNLSNLASANILLADLEAGSGDQADRNALLEAEKVLIQAVAAYGEAGEEEVASKEGTRLAEVQRRLAR